MPVIQKPEKNMLFGGRTLVVFRPRVARVSDGREPAQAAATPSRKRTPSHTADAVQRNHRPPNM